MIRNINLGKVEDRHDSKTKNLEARTAQDDTERALLKGAMSNFN